VPISIIGASPTLNQYGYLPKPMWIDLVNYVRQKGAFQKLIKHVKNKWFQVKAAEIELKMSRSKSAWKS
jgi:hypothetical protein